MEADFWHRKWADGETGFHRKQPHHLLVEHFGSLSLPAGSRIFVPLCGRTVDIGWLQSQGYKVIGVEFNRRAVEGLFDDLGLVPDVYPDKAITRFSATGLNVFVGDIFDLQTENLGAVDGVYDRAALVALPVATRQHYAQHLSQLAPGAPQLLITFKYDQAMMQGPPFSVPPQELAQIYGDIYQLELLQSRPVDGGLMGEMECEEVVWHLHPPRD